MNNVENRAKLAYQSVKALVSGTCTTVKLAVGLVTGSINKLVTGTCDAISSIL